MLRFVYPIVGAAQLRFAADIEVEKELRNRIARDFSDVRSSLKSDPCTFETYSHSDEIVITVL
jgi:hypothetical protein